MVHRVARVVVFLSPAYCSSPNCAVEFLEAIQDASKCLICVLEDIDPSIIEFLEEIEIPIVYGIPALCEALDREVRDMTNQRLLNWWRQQKIGGAGVPTNVVPKGWPIPKWKLFGRPFVGEKSLAVGPVYLAGDCRSSGMRVALPYLFILSFLGFAVNLWDLFNKWTHTTMSSTPGDTSNYSFSSHSSIDFVWLIAVLLCNLIPFLAWPNLFETRRSLHVALKPLLASKSLGGGVKVRVVGDSADSLVQNLRAFLRLIGHASTEYETIDIASAMRIIRENERALARRRETENDLSLRYKDDGLKGQGSEQVITIYVLNSLPTRDALFSGGPGELEATFAFDRFSLFVWNGDGDCFTPDAVGKKLMRFLVLVTRWDKALLAGNLFSAIGIRVVDILHG